DARCIKKRQSVGLPFRMDLVGFAHANPGLILDLSVICLKGPPSLCEPSDGTNFGHTKFFTIYSASPDKILR
ncbi:MAG: hypothetical protein J6X34_03160, partial [Clostridia bacterium]|nr:hypothetical protein [Clostridia bacterium]